MYYGRVATIHVRSNPDFQSLVDTFHMYKAGEYSAGLGMQSKYFASIRNDISSNISDMVSGDSGMQGVKIPNAFKMPLRPMTHSELFDFRDSFEDILREFPYENRTEIVHDLHAFVSFAKGIHDVSKKRYKSMQS